MSENEIKRFMIDIEITSLRARSAACSSFCFNTKMQLEASVVDAQIEALELLKLEIE